MKMPRKTMKRSMVLFCGVQIATFGFFACGKKDSKAADPASTISAGTAGVSQVEGNEVTVLGQLALSSGLRLAETPKGILAFNMVKGKVSGDPQKIDVAEDGSFSVPLKKADAALDFLIAEMAKDRADRDFAAMADAVNEGLDVQGGAITAEKLEGMSEEELTEGISQAAEENQSGGKMTVLVSYDVSGDAVAEAASFQFINLPTAGGASLAAIPNVNLKGSVSLGEISGTGTDISAAIQADEALDLSDEAIESLADASQTLKLLKNEYMNTDWGVTPFYSWTSNVTSADVIDQYYDVTKSTYYGYGLYIPQKAKDAGFTYEQVCGGSTIITFAPPSALEVVNGSSSTSVTSFDNANATVSSQGGSRMCYSANGMYIREDVRDDETSFMLNVGLGGGVQVFPEGLWTMEVGSSEVGRFDLATSKPIDSDNNPLVFIPSVQFVKSGNYITEAKIKLYSYAGGAFNQVTDMASVVKLVSELTASITRESDDGEAMAQADLGAADEDGVFTVMFDGSESDGDDVRNNKVAVSDIGSFSVYYAIGDANYRIEFRSDNQ